MYWPKRYYRGLSKKKQSVSKKEIKIVSEISEVTINKCFKKLEKIKDELLPAIILKKYSCC